MKHRFLLTLICACFATANLQAKDPVVVSPEYYRVLFENEVVRVLEMKLPSGAADKEHSHPTETVYFQKGGHLRITLPNGKVIEREVKDGSVMFHGPWTHQVTNIGETEVLAIITEQKIEPPMEDKGHAH